MAYTKKEALSIVFSCAAQYKENLAERSLLFVSIDKHKKVHCLETTFDASNFMHMTGFKAAKKVKKEKPENDEREEKIEHVVIQPLHFWELCLKQRLTEEDFEFAEDGTTHLKLSVLPGLVKCNLSAKMLGDYNMSQPKLYTEKIAGGVNACVGFVRTKGTGRYVPNTVLDGDIRKKVVRPDRIILTYRKRRGEDQYEELVYKAKKVDWSKINLPEEYKYLPLPSSDDICVETKIAEKPTGISDEKLKKETVLEKYDTEIMNAIVTYHDLEWTDDQIIKKLIQRFGLSDEQAVDYMLQLDEK